MVVESEREGEREAAGGRSARSGHQKIKSMMMMMMMMMMKMMMKMMK